VICGVAYPCGDADIIRLILDTSAGGKKRIAKSLTHFRSALEVMERHTCVQIDAMAVPSKRIEAVMHQPSRAGDRPPDALEETTRALLEHSRSHPASLYWRDDSITMLFDALKLRGGDQDPPGCPKMRSVSSLVILSTC